MLGNDELQSAIHLRDEITDASPLNNQDYCQYFKVESATQFREILEQINEQTRNGLKPILHFEAHGEKDDGIQIAASKELISWAELIQILQKINKNTRNNLGVVMAACYGLYAIKPLKFLKPSPYYFLIGSDETVPAGFIDDQMKLFYKTLFQSNSLEAAMEVLQTKFKQFQAEDFFYNTFKDYIENACIGRAGQQRVENLITQQVKDGYITNRAELREKRASAKKFVKAMLNKYPNNDITFDKSLIHKEVKFTSRT